MHSYLPFNRFRDRRTVSAPLCLLIALLAAFFMGGVQTAQAQYLQNVGPVTVTTDKPDYAPRSNAVFTGTGFKPYEDVQLKVKNLFRACNTVAADSSYLPWTVKADVNGGFVTNWTVCDCLGDSLRLKATGLTSNFIAYAYFTDGDIRVESVSPNPFNPIGSNSATLSVKNYAGNTLNKHRVQILNSNSEKVWESSEFGLNAGNNTQISWDGKNNLISPIDFVPDGLYTVRVVDDKGVANTATGATQIITVETAPRVKINQALSQSDPTSASPIIFSVVFSENVTGFSTGDVTLSGTAGATTATVSGSGSNYTVAVTGMSASGTVIASIAAGVAVDGTGKINVSSTSTDNTVTYNLTTIGTNTVLSSSLNPSVYGQSVSFIATVTSASGSPTGNVVFKNGTTTLGTMALANVNGTQQATFTTNFLVANTIGHSITAEYQPATGTNFVGSTSTAFSQIVNKKALTASLTGVVSKEYNGNAAATLAAANYELSGVVGTDAVVLNNPAAGSYNDKTVSTGKQVTVNGLQISGADAGNYSVNTTATANIGTITPASLVIGITAADKEYNGNRDAATTAAITSGLVAGDVVTVA
ncbi:Ig-like domain repeat protein, partial [Flavisolibacter sp. BT320]|nr:Ig-like domain repeat protein [Flavisolibacter longurius]